MSNSETAKPIEFQANATAQPIASPHGRITLGTLVSYLFGSREAIRALATHRDTVGLGLIFVLSAAFAREYDGEDLLHEPWHLLLPLVASLGTSLVLFCLVEYVARCRESECARFLSRYRSFLGLYWMTAPLAWLYAVPVERFLSPADAMAANLWFLGIVSLWRVLLITRVFSVLHSPRDGAASPASFFFVVMLFADSLAVFLVGFIDLPVLVLMGGVRLTETESVLADTKLLVTFFGVLTWPIWLIGTLAVASGKTPWSWANADLSIRHPISAPVKCLAAASVLVWIAVLPWTQPEQQLRGSVERDLREGRYREALTTMSAHQRDEFPPHWNPPPRIGSARERPRILKIVVALSPTDAPWVRQLFLDKFEAALGRSYFPMETLWVQADPAEILSVLVSQPEGKAILSRQRELLSKLQRWRHDSSDEAKQKINAMLVQLIEPPVEISGDAREVEWPDLYVRSWHEYLTQLEQIEDRELVLKTHEARLRTVLDEPRFVPADVLFRVRKLLTPAFPANAGQSDAP